MSDRPRRLPREFPGYAIKSGPKDNFECWNAFGDAHEPRRNLSLKDEYGNNIITVYGLDPEQLASLHAMLGAELGLAPAITLAHLKAMHKQLSDIIAIVEPPPPPFNPFDDTQAVPMPTADLTHTDAPDGGSGEG